MVDEDAATGRERVGQHRHQVGRLVLVGDLVQDAAQDQADRLVPVEQFAGGAQHAFGVAQVALDGEGAPVVGQQGGRVRDHHRIVVQVDDAYVLIETLGNLMDVLRGGQAGANVEQLADTLVANHVADGAGENLALQSRANSGRGHRDHHPVGQRPVNRVIIPPAKQVVVHAGTVGAGGVDLGRLGHERTLWLAEARAHGKYHSSL
jgi:hypothetical protein